MKIYAIFTSIIFSSIILILLFSCEDKKNNNNNLISGDSTKITDYNNWKVFLKRDGLIGDRQEVDNTGLILGFRGNSVLFVSGIYVGVQKQGTPFVSKAYPYTYPAEFQPGYIVNDTPANIDQLQASPSNQSFIYLIDQTQSGHDWLNWPIAFGAPAIGNLPKLISDADTWTVYNDLDSLRHGSQTSYPRYGNANAVLGIQVSQSTYQFSNASSSDAVYIHLRLTNKSNHTYPQSFIGYICDFDIQCLFNLLASDTLRNTAYLYCSDSTFGVAVGAQLLYCSELNGTQVIPAAMTWYIKNIDEAANDAGQYNLLKGLQRDGSPRTYGASYKSQYDFPGDPVTGTGILDTLASDYRTLISAGPFTWNPGQTVEVVFSLVGGTGANRSAAITNLRQNADAIAADFKNNIVNLIH